MDPIADFLSQIKNAQAVNHSTVKVPYSKVKHEIAKLLKKEGFIKNVKTKGRKKKNIVINLKYENKEPAIKHLERISKPGRRVYTPADEISSVRGGYGISIISTSRGLVTNKEARKRHLGGEVLCKVW